MEKYTPRFLEGIDREGGGMYFLLFLVVWLHETGAGFLARGTPRTKMPQHSHGVRHSLHGRRSAVGGCLSVSSEAGGYTLSHLVRLFSDGA